jgi:hypothetical protein
LPFAGHTEETVVGVPKFGTHAFLQTASDGGAQHETKNMFLAQGSLRGAMRAKHKFSDVLHQIHADVGDHTANAARGVADETPSNLLSIRRVLPESVAKLRVVRSLREKICRFADDLTHLSTSGSLTDGHLPSVLLQLEKHDADNGDPNNLKGLQDGLGKLICSCLVGVRNTSDPFTARGNPDVRYQEILREQGFIQTVIRILNILFSKDHLAIPLQALAENTRWGKALLIFGKLIFRLLTVVMTDNVANKQQVQPYTDLLIGFLGVRMHVAEALQALFIENDNLLYSQAADSLAQSLYRIFLAQPYTARHFNLITTLCFHRGTGILANQNMLCQMFFPDAYAGDGERVERPVPLVYARREASPGQKGACVIRLTADAAKFDCKDDSFIIDQPDFQHAADGKHVKLYEFYLAQLHAFHNMCIGRNRPALDALIEVSTLYAITYRDLLDAVRSELLPMELRSICADLIRVLYIDREPCSSFTPVALSLIWRSRAPPDSRMHRVIVNPWEKCNTDTVPEAGFQRFVDFTQFFFNSLQNQDTPNDEEIAFVLSLVKSLKLLLSFGVIGGVIEHDSGQVIKRDHAGYPVIEIKERVAPIVNVLVKLLDGRPNAEVDADVSYGLEKVMSKAGLHRGSVVPISDKRSTKPTQGRAIEAQAELKCLICSTLFFVFEMRLHYRLQRAFDVYCEKFVPTLLAVAKVPDDEMKLIKPSFSLLGRMGSMPKSRRDKDFFSIALSHDDEDDPTGSGGAVETHRLQELAEILRKSVACAEYETFGEPIIGHAVREIQDPSAKIPSYLEILFDTSLSHHPELLRRSFQLIDRHMSQRTAFTGACSASTTLTSPQQIEAHYAVVSCVTELNRLRKWLGSNVKAKNDDAFETSCKILNQLSRLCRISGADTDTGTREDTADDTFLVDIGGVDILVNLPTDGYEANALAAVMINAGLVDYLRVILRMALKRSPQPGMPDACMDWPLLKLKNAVFAVIQSLTLNLLPEMMSGGVGVSSHRSSIRSTNHKPKMHGDLRAGRRARQETFYADLVTITSHMGVEKLVAANAISAIMGDNVSLCKRLPRGFYSNVVGLLANHGRRARWLRLLITSIMPSASERPLRVQQELVLDSLLLMETAGKGVVDMRSNMRDEDTRTKFIEMDIKAKHDSGESSETLAEWLREAAQVGNPLDFHLTSVELLTAIAANNKPAKLRVLSIPGCGFTDLVGKACGVLDPVGVYVPASKYSYTPAGDSSADDSKHIDDLVDSLCTSVSAVIASTNLRGMSVLFGKSVYIRLIHEIYLMPNHNEACLAVRDSKSCMWVASGSDQRALIDELLDALDAGGRLPGIDDVHVAHQHLSSGEHNATESESFASNVVTFAITVVVPALHSYFKTHHEFTEYMDVERKDEVVGRIADGLHNLMDVMLKREMFDARSSEKVLGLHRLVVSLKAAVTVPGAGAYSKLSDSHHDSMAATFQSKSIRQSMKNQELVGDEVPPGERHRHALLNTLKAGMRGYEDEEYRSLLVTLGWRAFAEELCSAIGIVGGLETPKAQGTKFLAYLLAQCSDVDDDAEDALQSTRAGGESGSTHAYSVLITRNSPTQFGDVVQRLTAMLRGVSSLREIDVDERLLFRLTRVLTGMLVVTDPHATTQIDASFTAWEYFQHHENAAAEHIATAAASGSFGGMSPGHGNACSSLAGPKVMSWAQQRMYIWGATSAAMHLFSITDEYSPRLEGQSLDLLFLLLEKGNRSVQDSIIFLQSSKLGTQFLRKVSGIINQGSDDAKIYLKTVKCIAEITKSQSYDVAKADDDLMTTRANHVKKLMRLCRVIAILRLFCEGHHSGAQNMLRAQVGNPRSINIVADLSSLFVSVHEMFRTALTNGDEILGSLVEQLLLTMTEICQGPCFENQDLLVRSSNLLLGINCMCIDTSHEARNNVIAAAASSSLELRAFDLCNRMKCAAFKLLKSFLEGPGAGLRAMELLEFVRVETLMQQATIAFASHNLLSTQDSELSQRMLCESFAAIELLHLLRDADSSNFAHVSDVLQASPQVLKRFEEEYRSVEIAWMGSVFRTYFRLDAMCLSVEKSYGRSSEISQSIHDIPRADPHLKARAFTIKLLVAHNRIKLLDHFSNQSGAVIRWATQHQQMLVKAPYKHAVIVGFVLILLWRGPPKDPWSSVASTRWHTGGDEAWAKGLDTLVSCVSILQICILAVSLWVCVRIEVPLARAEIAAERNIETFASSTGAEKKSQEEDFLKIITRNLQNVFGLGASRLTSTLPRRGREPHVNHRETENKSQRLEDDSQTNNKRGDENAVGSPSMQLKPPPPRPHKHIFLVDGLSKMQTLIRERNSHLVLLIAYRVAQLALGMYSFYMPMALFAPVLDYVLLFEGRLVFGAAVKAFPSLRRTVYVIVAVFALVCVMDYSVFGASDTLYGSFTGHVVNGLEGDIKDFLQLPGYGIN